MGSAADDYDALFIPGGFGVAQLFCDFQLNGPKMQLISPVEAFLQEFRDQKKPVAACCISPILLARLYGKQFGGPGCKITLGKSTGTAEDWPYGDAVNVARDFGNELVEADVNEVVVDKENLLFSTPAYMKNAKPHEVYEGIEKMVREVHEFLSSRKG